MTKQRAFTLIELLVVVAIIGILAAIAVPNFLCSLVKAKVARAQADLKSLSTSIEMYRLDHNNLILSSAEMSSAGIASDSLWVWSQLTHPIEYLSSGGVQDPFKIPRSDENSAFPEFVQKGVYGFNKEDKSRWRAYSIGPAQRHEVATLIPYQATNGCLSAGGIIRTHAGPVE